MFESGSGELLHNKKELPIYARASKMLCTQEWVHVLLHSQLEKSSICTMVPFAIDINSVFVVDMNKLSSAKDIFCDDMGVWKWGGSYRKWCLPDEDGSIEVLESQAEYGSYRVWKRYYSLKSNPDVRRMVVMLEGK